MIILQLKISIQNSLNINSNITYLWQYSTQNISWNNIPGETNQNYLIKSNDGGFYIRCIVQYSDIQYIVSVDNIVPYQSIFYLKGKLLVGNNLEVSNKSNTNINNYNNFEYAWL